ncbi:uncharacterized protein Z519_11660 [Cladophialophora bantiana CBS 173.52]|uniref:Uncharacterized protein n=1 Tax=Cladophialophora bantiana (strain ATCC 10958 / CBS 173.52 / CDC B-1940 / NIH 8579) TaxID=1442370 RepID=A0A0D2EC41_CLAB1|nr:uncharacterized protein Z519_11660 [Cladophialophora bantiana CBS 173.52]KIW87686.1 hypothetical protein Z519_11660 [Cladophialophora bantiana CBS 173.52]
MSSNMEDNIYTPLPPKLPPKTKQHDEDVPIEYVVEKRSPRHLKVKVIHDHLDDEDAHPKVESPSPPRKRDSGKYYMTGALVDDDRDGVRREYDRVRPDPEVQKLRDELEREERKRRQAELTAAAEKEKADRLKVDLEFEKRQRSLEKRERELADREKRLKQEEREEARRPRERQGVVVHNPPAVAPSVLPIREPKRSALDRARDDYEHLRSQQAREDRRPATGDRRARRQSIIIVDDENDRDRDRRQRR